MAKHKISSASEPGVEADASRRFIRETVEKLRIRLLDLTVRNPLLSFKHTARSPRYIRVVDELPDQLYQRLTSELVMHFRSLGDAVDEPTDERTISFRRALDAARLDDAEYLKDVEDLGDDPGEKSLKRIEDALRIRVREQLGMTPRAASFGNTAAEAAKRAGINPSYDLPTTAPPSSHRKGQGTSKHSDSAIQTLLFEEQMQATHARIRERVRLSIQETGVNPLFLVFGFLEWYEADSSELPLHAPLLLLPLDIDRTLVRRHWRYTVISSGEKPLVNVTLAERLRRDFKIELPQFDEDVDSPESYFKKLQVVIEQHKAWKVRRWITLGLFSFARIAMYQDLDPAKWETSGGVESHEGFRRLVGASSSTSTIDSDNNRPHPAYHSADDLDEHETETPLIADADSSQLAAIRQALSGRDLVIEGPPGTGKSQTITNIIAAALAAGKKVLFVAEKMAALNVVRDRLAHANLADFCLELHSTQANRRDMFAAIERRLKRPRNRSVDQDHASATAELRKARKRLQATVAGLGQTVGNLGITAQELIWRCQYFRSKTCNLPLEIDDITFEDVENTSEIDVGRIVAAFELFERTRSSLMQSFGPPQRHHWYGVARHNISQFAAEDIVRKVSTLARITHDAETALRRVSELIQTKFERLADLNAIAVAGRIGSLNCTAPDDLIVRMAKPQARTAIETFVGQVNEYRTTRAALSSFFANSELPSVAAVKSLINLSRAAVDAGFRDASVSESRPLIERRKRESEALDSLRRFVADAAAQVQWREPITPEFESALVLTADIAAEATPAILSRRNASVANGTATTILRAAMETKEALVRTRVALSESYSIEHVQSPDECRQHAASLRSASMWPLYLFGRKVREARAAFRVLQRDKFKLDRFAMARALDEIANWKESVQAFQANNEIREAIGGKPFTIQTQFLEHLCAAEWADTVRAGLPADNAPRRQLRSILLYGAPQEVELIANLKHDRRYADFCKVVRTPALSTRTVAEHAASATKRAEASGQIEQTLSKIALAPTVKFLDCERIAAQLLHLYDLQDEIMSSKVASEVLGATFAGTDTSLDKIVEALNFLSSLDVAALPDEIRSWVLNGNPVERLNRIRELAIECDRIASEFSKTLDDLGQICRIDMKRWIGCQSPFEVLAGDLKNHLDACAKDPIGLQQLIDDCRASDEIRKVGLYRIVSTLEKANHDLVNLGDIAQRVIYQSYVRATIATNPALASFVGERHENIRKQFQTFDKKLQELTQVKIAHDLSRAAVEAGSNNGPKKQWTGLALIHNEISKQKAHIPIRDLLSRAGDSVQQLMPCFMMSPLSVAQLLQPGRVKFDLVIMDEASQLRPEDAVGSILRGSQVIVVGDPKQLPPTNFFVRSDGVEDDGDNVTAADAQSILDQAMSVLRPYPRLMWHYRSRHPSLIAYSNREFYDNELVIFPSPFQDHKAFGVYYEFVKDGVFSGRINVPEARRVAQAAIEYARDYPDRSVGIVTLNQPQAEYLQLEFDRLEGEHEGFAAWRRNREESLEPFFVKNLENVQGDERDAIFISTVYGADEAGNFHRRFGPINNVGGHRRLNVLFTRAKYQTRVFSSMEPGMIRTDEESPWGVRALKGYLKFARDGVFDDAMPTGRAPQSDFEIAVAGVLQRAGFDAVPQVGVAGYFIDIGVRHPKLPGEFVLGVECDGAPYHSTKSARERDRLRQEILERLKWRIHRIWSLDWYRNQEREAARLLKAVSEATLAMF